MNTARLNQGTPLLLNAVSKHYAENIVLNQLDLHITAGPSRSVARCRASGAGCGRAGESRAGMACRTFWRAETACGAGKSVDSSTRFIIA